MESEKPLSGKTALVTGAAKRLGCAVAWRLSRAGAGVVLHYNTSRNEAEALKAEITASGGAAWCVQANLDGERAAANLFSAAITAAGPIHFLVNNASIFPLQDFAVLDEQSLLENLRVNTLAPLALCKALHAQGVEGAIVNMLDSRILDYDALHVPYHLSKRSLHTLTKIMALEFAPRIRVNAVAPGLVLPPSGKDEAYLAQLSTELPLKKHGKAEDVADAALYLLQSAFVTGQVLYVDGGRHLKAQLYG